MPPRKKALPPVKFGSEHEWHAAGDALVRRLYADGKLPTDSFHSYHCSCDTCQIGSSYLLKAQRDSSCSGELITQPFLFSDIAGAVEIYNLIERAAVDIDAIPGQSAGLHVHVSRVNVTCGPWYTANNIDTHYHTLGALYAWLLNHEHWLVHRLSAGVFPRNRGFNVDLAPIIRRTLNVDSATEAMSRFNRSSEYVFRCTDAISDDAGHHAQISTRTSTGSTWEFRFWNSTRSAWRMELATRISVLLTDVDFLTTTFDATSDADRVAGIELFDPIAAELAARQLDYNTSPCQESLSAFRWNL